MAFYYILYEEFPNPMFIGPGQYACSKKIDP